MSAIITVASLAGCGDIPDIVRSEKPVEVEEGLPGYWEPTMRTVSECHLKVRRDDGSWEDITLEPGKLAIGKTSPYHCILKVTGENIIPMEGPYLEDYLTKKFPYTLGEDNRLESPLIPQRYEITICTIEKMTNKNCQLRIDYEGASTWHDPDGPAEAEADTICLRRSDVINFQRLR